MQENACWYLIGKVLVSNGYLIKIISSIFVHFLILVFNEIDSQADAVQNQCHVHLLPALLITSVHRLINKYRIRQSGHHIWLSSCATEIKTELCIRMGEKCGLFLSDSEHGFSCC